MNTNITFDELREAWLLACSAEEAGWENWFIAEYFKNKPTPEDVAAMKDLAQRVLKAQKNLNALAARIHSRQENEP